MAGSYGYRFVTASDSISLLTASAALDMGLAHPIMHYVGMAAVSFVPRPTVLESMTYAIGVSRLGLLATASVSIALLGFALLVRWMDRRLTSQADRLKESQLRTQRVIGDRTEGVLVLDLNGRIVEINEAAAELFGLPLELRDRSGYQNAFDVFLPGGKEIPRVEWPGARALRGDFVHAMELDIVRRDTGKKSIVEVSSAAIHNHAGVMKQVILSYRDVTEQKRIDEARTRLAAIVESSEDAIISKEKDGRVNSWNASAERLFGYTAVEMVGQSIRRLLPADRQDEEDEIMDRIRAGETVEHFETERIRKDGRVIHVSLTISPIRDVSGALVGVSKIARDITDRIKLERQLRQSQKMEAVGQLTGGIAHGFNNLLGVIIGNLDLLEREVCNDQAKLKRVQTAIKAATRGADLTRRLLMFSSKDELRPSSIVLEESIESMAELAARTLGPEITLVKHFDSSLPAIYVDSNGLESALLNLVINARDAMPDGGVLTIATSLHVIDESHPGVHSGEVVPGNYVCISVTDTGTGMPRGDVDRAFEPFFTTKPKGKGTGLGLAMVYGFAKQSGGLARIDSEPGCGTMVSLYLPFAKGLPRTVATKPVALRTPAKARGTVLVVDEEAELLEIALCYLADLGYDALRAKDAAAALAVLSRKAIDVLVTDIVMPGGMNGVRLAQEAKLIHPEMKVIYCSGFPAETLAERGHTLVDGALLYKPYQRREFEATIRKVLE